MSGIEFVVIALGLIAGIGFSLALAQVVLEQGNADRSVGPWRRAPRTPPVPPSLPSTYASLLRNERSRWAAGWEPLLERLAALGDDTALIEAPAQFDPAWLEQRITKLEELNGPFPYGQGTETDAS